MPSRQRRKLVPLPLRLQKARLGWKGGDTLLAAPSDAAPSPAENVKQMLEDSATCSRRASNRVIWLKSWGSIMDIAWWSKPDNPCVPRGE